MAVVLVDAENVRRSRWPNVEAADLVELCRRWAAETASTVIVVFDGPAPPGVDEDREACRVVGSGAASADERLLDEARRLSAAGQPVRLATSDRALRAAAAPFVEEAIGGGTFLRELLGAA